MTFPEPCRLSLVGHDETPFLHDSRPGAGGRSGPGWFDSSWDLQRGLEVREGWPGDVRLGDWLDAFLRLQPAPVAFGEASSSAR